MCRLWRIHQALYCFGYDLEENRDIKDMLLECFINVNYIKKEEVSRFFSFWLVGGLLMDCFLKFMWLLFILCCFVEKLA